MDIESEVDVRSPQGPDSHKPAFVGGSSSTTLINTPPHTGEASEFEDSTMNLRDEEDGTGNGDAESIFQARLRISPEGIPYPSSIHLRNILTGFSDTQDSMPSASIASIFDSGDKLPTMKARGNYTKMACNFCMGRKKKCDGKHPCDNCIEKNVECSYDRPMKKRGRVAFAEHGGKRGPIAVSEVREESVISIVRKATPPISGIHPYLPMIRSPSQIQMESHPSLRTMVSTASDGTVSYLIPTPVLVPIVVMVNSPMGRPWPNTSIPSPISPMDNEASNQLKAADISVCSSGKMTSSSVSQNGSPECVHAFGNFAADMDTESSGESTAGEYSIKSTVEELTIESILELHELCVAVSGGQKNMLAELSKDFTMIGPSSNVFQLMTPDASSLEQLLAIYFLRCHSEWPVLHMRSFMRSWSKSYSSFLICCLATCASVYIPSKCASSCNDECFTNGDIFFTKCMLILDKKKNFSVEDHFGISLLCRYAARSGKVKESSRLFDIYFDILPRLGIHRSSEQLDILRSDSPQFIADEVCVRAFWTSQCMVIFYRALSGRRVNHPSFGDWSSRFPVSPQLWDTEDPVLPNYIDNDAIEEQRKFVNRPLSLRHNTFELPGQKSSWILKLHLSKIKLAIFEFLGSREGQEMHRGVTTGSQALEVIERALNNWYICLITYLKQYVQAVGGPHIGLEYWSLSRLMCSYCMCIMQLYRPLCFSSLVHGRDPKGIKSDLFLRLRKTATDVSSIMSQALEHNPTFSGLHNTVGSVIFYSCSIHIMVAVFASHDPVLVADAIFKCHQNLKALRVIGRYTMGCRLKYLPFLEATVAAIEGQYPTTSGQSRKRFSLREMEMMDVVEMF